MSQSCIWNVIFKHAREHCSQLVFSCKAKNSCRFCLHLGQVEVRQNTVVRKQIKIHSFQSHLFKSVMFLHMQRASILTGRLNSDKVFVCLLCMEKQNRFIKIKMCDLKIFLVTISTKLKDKNDGPSIQESSQSLKGAIYRVRKYIASSQMYSAWSSAIAVKWILVQFPMT